MSFTSTVFFFLFFPLCLAGYYLIRPSLRNAFLVLASLAFYAWGETKYVLPLIFSIAVNYLLGLAMERALASAEALTGKSSAEGYRRRAWLWLVLALAFNFGMLFYFKYLAFAVGTVNSLFRLRFTIPAVGLPLGISFYTFRTVSYCLDVYWRRTTAAKNPIDMALYVSFFPQVSMGPITRYSDFAGQLHDRTFDADIFADGIKQIIVGLFKKLVIANNLGTMVDYAFAMEHGERTVVLAWMGIIGYLIQLYYDFSGYSDIAIGLGKLFGFETPQNFDYPYASKSVGEFWNRWHMTLGVWLRDYIYTPAFRGVMGRRKISIYQCDIIALFVTWLFSGLWHGSAWHYVAWGLYQFAFIALERTVEAYEKKKRRRLKLKKQPETKRHAILAHVYFQLVLIIGFVMFRIDGFWNFFPYVGSMFGLLGNAFINTNTIYYWSQNVVLLAVGGIFCFPVMKKLNELCDRCGGALRTARDVLTPVAYMASAIIAVAFVFTSTYQAFIYFQF